MASIGNDSDFGFDVDDDFGFGRDEEEEELKQPPEEQPVDDDFGFGRDEEEEELEQQPEEQTTEEPDIQQPQQQATVPTAQQLEGNSHSYHRSIFVFAVLQQYLLLLSLTISLHTKETPLICPLGLEQACSKRVVKHLLLSAPGCL